MNNFISRISAFANDESGVTAIEYGLIAALVGVTAAAGAVTLKDGLSTLFNSIGNTVVAFIDNLT